MLLSFRDRRHPRPRPQDCKFREHNAAFIKHCLLPRLVRSIADATYCHYFTMAMHTLDVPGWPAGFFWDEVRVAVLGDTRGTPGDARILLHACFAFRRRSGDVAQLARLDEQSPHACGRSSCCVRSRSTLPPPPARLPAAPVRIPTANATPRRWWR